jgi:hypothetical protein
VAISIDWGNTFVISVPQSDLSLVSGTLYDFDTDAFRLELKDLEDDVEGIVWTSTHVHNTEVTLSGTIYARAIEVIAPYSITFENTGSAYSIRSIGSNNNVFDEPAGILNPTPLVSYISTNSAGLIIAETGTSGLTPTESQQLDDINTNVDQLIVDVAALTALTDLLKTSNDLTNEQANAQHITSRTTGQVILRNTTTTERWEADAWEDEGMSIAYGTNPDTGIEAVGMLVAVAWS